MIEQQLRARLTVMANSHLLSSTSERKDELETWGKKKEKDNFTSWVIMSIVQKLQLVG